MTYDDLKCQLDDCQKALLSLYNEREGLLEEVQAYRNAARLYGIDPTTMLSLAKSQVKTCADNIRLVEKMQEIFKLFQYVPEDLAEQDIISAIAQYDGDGSKPYCDLVYCGLSIIRNYLMKRGEYDEWRKGNLPDDF